MGLFLLVASEVALALQVAQATIVGTVRDRETGVSLPHATVVLTDLDRASETDPSGRYVLRNIPPGPQHLEVRLFGYTPRMLHALVPRDGELEIDIALRAAPIPLDPVHVRRRTPIRGVEAEERPPGARVLSIAAVRDHPLLAEPDVLQALSGGEVVVRPESPSGLHVRGGAADQTGYLLDGVPIFSPYHAAGVFSAWNPDAVARVRLAAPAPSETLPDALSGMVSAETLAPGARLRVQGGASSTQARATVDGPLGFADGGYLLSLRIGFPGIIAPDDEASYMRGSTADRIAKIEARAFGGRIRMLGYDSENEIDAAASAQEPPAEAPARHRFGWRSRSVAADWRRPFGAADITLRLWSATAAAGAVWAAGEPDATELVASRRDVGVLATVERRRADARTLAGIRLQRSVTAYHVGSASAAPSWTAAARTPLAAIFLEEARPIAQRLRLEVGASITAAAGGLHLGPSGALHWTPTERWLLSGRYTRLHQYAQSLRNAESVVGQIFPADLWVGAGSNGVPAARSDLLSLAGEFRPWPGARAAASLYARDFAGLLLAAPRAGDPFATTGFVSGSGTAHGVSAEFAAGGARYGGLIGYGWQRVRFAHGDTSWVPEHGARHMFEAGLIVFPTPSSSVRLGATGILGRRATIASGPFEWESCNLLDEGCEFGGSPRTDGRALGGTTLPPYLRLDAGIRKHWHVELRGQSARIALFGTVTNVFDRNNLLTYVRDPLTGERTEIPMRPLAPLVIGVDWTF